MMVMMLPETLDFKPEEETLRLELRDWIATHDNGPPPASYEEKIKALVQWQGALHAAGFVGLSWPEEYGGRGMSLGAEAIFGEELARAGAAELINRLAVYTWGPTILDLGTPDQKQRFLPGMLDASEIWCQGFSEPDAGSDLAAVRTRAVRDGDEYVVTGQKVWTSRAEISAWSAMLVRSDADSARDKGLSLMVIDMNSEGITIRPLPQMLNEPHFSEVFLDEVRVSAANVIGIAGEGWRAAMHAMSYERGLFALERQIRLRRRLGDLSERLRREDSLNAAALERLGRLDAKLTLLRAQTYRSLAEQVTGSQVRGATSVDKLFLAEVYQEVFAVAFDLLGPDVACSADGGWAHDLLESRSISIYSGTSEIQKNIIMRQLLDIR